MARLSPRALWAALFLPAALMAGIGWRAEIELHGWAGLAWLSWFHWAVPLSIALFIACALALVRRTQTIAPRRLGGLGLALVAFGVLGHVWTQVALFTVYSRSLMFAPHARSIFVLGFASLALTPLIFAALLAALRQRPGWLPLIASLALYLSAVPLASAALDVDAVEAVKRGWPVPLLFVALALLFWPRPAAATR